MFVGSVMIWLPRQRFLLMAVATKSLVFFFYLILVSSFFFFFLVPSPCVCIPAHTSVVCGVEIQLHWCSMCPWSPIEPVWQIGSQSVLSAFRVYLHLLQIYFFLIPGVLHNQTLRTNVNVCISNRFQWCHWRRSDIWPPLLSWVSLSGFWWFFQEGEEELYTTLQATVIAILFFWLYFSFTYFCTPKYKLT